MYTYEDFLEVIKTLRSEHGCPWDREQTHTSLKQCMLEEAYEVVDGIQTYEATGDYQNLREELGDVLLQVVLHSQIASEEGYFTMEDVVDEICEKMVRRHPHVFGKEKTDIKNLQEVSFGQKVDTSDKVLEQWEEIKKREKSEETLADTLNRVAKAYPANIRAAKVQKKAAKSGFEFESLTQVLGKVKEELLELEEVITKEKISENEKNCRLDEEFGDLLFSMINLSRFLDLNAENSLTNATNKFINRCTGIELLAQQQGKKLNKMSADELDALWENLKASQ